MVSKYLNLDDMLRDYVETALWSSTDCDEDGNGGDSLDALYGYDDLAPEALESMRADLVGFLELLDEEGVDWESQWDPAHFAHVFWLTRNHHGAGFWDRGRSLGDVLTKWAHTYGESDLYVGDDGLVHVS